MKRVFEQEKIKGYWSGPDGLGFTSREKVSFNLILRKIESVGVDINIEIPSIEILLKKIEDIWYSKKSFIFITGPIKDREPSERLFLEYDSTGGVRGHKIIYKDYPDEIYPWAQDIIFFTYNKKINSG